MFLYCAYDTKYFESETPQYLYTNTFTSTNCVKNCLTILFIEYLLRIYFDRTYYL